MNTHHASLFRYDSYQDDMGTLVEQVDRHSYRQLQERTCQSIKTFQNSWPLTDHHEMYKYVDGKSVKAPIQEWPLWDHGAGNLISIEEVKSKTSPENQDIAHWFLILLGEYLEPCPSPLGNWIVLNHVLLQSGWNREDCDLLFRGLPTSKLLKPAIGISTPKPLKNKDPYWLWLHPWMARSGWLTLEVVKRLHNNLEMMAQPVKKFDIQKIPNINIDNPVVVSDYRNYLDSAYLDTMYMLKAAKEHQLGLFMSITIYA